MQSEPFFEPNYGDFTVLTLIATLTLAVQPAPLKGQALLDDLSKRAVRFFWEQSEPTTGLTRDRGPNTKGGKENNPKISSVASTGYALAAYAIAAKRGWMPRATALKRARLTLDSILNKVEQNHGWYYHFIDWKTGKREWNCEVSSIDSSLLFAGMLMAEAGFKDPVYSRLAKRVMDRVDWKWMLTDGGQKPNELLFSMGWKPEGFLNARWGSYCEHMFLYVLAYGNFAAMPAGSWAAWNKPVVEYKGLTMLAGGPLFMHQMAQGFYDFRNRRDREGYDYFVEGRNATLGNRQYCIDNPKQMAGYGPDIWGLSACDIPDGYGAQGAPGDISDNGTLAPASAVASVIYTPELSIRAAEAFVQKYPTSYGQYGFTTGISPQAKWVSPDVIGIDLGQMLLNIENARDGLPNAWMMSRADTQRAYQKIGLRVTKEGPLEKRPMRIP